MARPSPAQALLNDAIKLYVLHLDNVQDNDEAWVKKCCCPMCEMVRKNIPRAMRDRIIARMAK